MQTSVSQQWTLKQKLIEKYAVQVNPVSSIALNATTHRMRGLCIAADVPGILMYTRPVTLICC